MHRRVVVGFCVVASLSAALTGVAHGSAPQSPTIPANRPTPLPSAVNGVVKAPRLVNVAPHCIAARAAGPSLARLFAMAGEVKVSLGAEECYRPLQEEVRLARQAAQPGNNPACVASVAHNASGAPVGQSYHGWGKAVDLTDAGVSLTFAAPGYAFMKRNAAAVGWNHPAFAEPGGSSCPEPWHWEWVGDGGNLHRSTVRGDAVALVPSANDHGVGVVTGLGVINSIGNFANRGSMGAIPIAWVMVGAAPTPGRGGYWMVGADGGVFGFGNARFYGSATKIHLAQPINGIAPTKTGRGYWLLAWDGGVFGFGDARFYGSTGRMRLNAPVDGIAATAGGKGYWLVASDGGIFGFGDAKFYGSMGGHRLAAPIVGIAATPGGKGYWLVGSDGHVFGFGDAHVYGSLGGLSSPAVSITSTKTGHGYWILLANGEVHAFGDAPVVSS